jgi:NADH-quinone oxidoreductase subunit J
MEAILFWLFSAGMLIGAFSVILNRNPVASALCLVLTMIFLAALFITLHAFFLAAVQVLVYAGAVMVLFLFIIMLLDLKAEERKQLRWFSCLIGLIMSGFLGGLLIRSLSSYNLPSSGLPPGGDDVKNVGLLLFQKYLLPFELTGVLLLVATIGVVLLSRKEKL